MTNIYLELTEQFNEGRLRCIVSSGQAVVLHQLAMMSKDGDWIVREDDEAMNHVLQVLAGYNARYRLGAPLDVRWMAGGWSAHFEFLHPQNGAKLRVRTDFVTRPPRLAADDLASLWQEQETRQWEFRSKLQTPAAVSSSPIHQTPVIDLRRLAELKKTNRERDYAVIGDLARRMDSPREQLLFSRSARDLLDLSVQHSDLVASLVAHRPLLARIVEGRDALEMALDAERRHWMRRNEDRLANYIAHAQVWYAAWPAVERDIAGSDLRVAHNQVVRAAEKDLPMHVAPNADDAG